MFDFLKTLLLWLFGAGFLAGFFGLSSGCKSSGYAEHEVTVLGSTFSYKIDHYKGDAEIPEGELGQAKITFDAEGVGLFGELWNALGFGDEEPDEESVESTETESVETVESEAEEDE